MCNNCIDLVSSAVLAAVLYLILSIELLLSFPLDRGSLPIEITQASAIASLRS